MKPATAYKALIIISGLMCMTAAGGIAYAIFADESLSTYSYLMIFLTIVNAALFFIVSLNIKIKAEKEENDV